MFLTPFFNQTATGIEITPNQASDFARNIAGDFNPIHDATDKRFCVPGDLLFALVLHRYGLSEKMDFEFTGMVGHGVLLQFPEQGCEQIVINDNKEKQYLKASRSGAITKQAKTIELLIRKYVAFSAHNFTEILIPLMKQNGVMINPQRPLVVYDSMGFTLDTLNFSDLSLELVTQDLNFSGKRGDVLLEFALFDGEKQIGKGRKTLLLGGLRPLDAEKIQRMLDIYEARRLGIIKQGW